MSELRLPQIKEEEKEQIRTASNIYMWLDSYDDLFSDFDPRPYAQRILSDDFISEAKKSAKEKGKGITELKLLMPHDKRKSHIESIIKKRLKEYFSHQHSILKKEVKATQRQGITFTIVGIVLMLTGAALLHHGAEGFLFYFLITLIEPSSWFLFWEGMNQSIFESRRFKEELDFSTKMSKVKVHFYSY